MTLAKAVEQESELREFIDRNEDAGEIMDMAYKLEGVVRNTGKHAGGVVIAPTTLTDFVPLYADQAGGVVVAVRPLRCRRGGSGEVRLPRAQDAHHHRLGGRRHQRRAHLAGRGGRGGEDAAAR